MTSIAITSDSLLDAARYSQEQQARPALGQRSGAGTLSVAIYNAFATWLVLHYRLSRNGLEAQIVIESWRQEYNHYRPHSSLGYMTPEEFARPCGKATPEPGPEEVGIDILQTLTL